MTAQKLEEHISNGRSFCPYRFLRISRDCDFYILENFITDVKRFYTNVQDVSRILQEWTAPTGCSRATQDKGDALEGPGSAHRADRSIKE